MSATTSSANNNTSGFPVCILTPCSNSHPFDERRIIVTRSEEDAVKIGRSVVRLQPSSNNAIFDCKVLSRNHAVLWMNANGQFVIKDTRSSNGTFINNDRLSASGEENEPRELFSGDILQLGVEIVDNAKKVASGCVTCIVRLLNERGEECAGRPKADHGTFSSLLQQQIPDNYTLVKNDKLFILDQYIKEATHRENLLGLKLQTLEEQLRIAQEALQTKWQEHVDQELLLSRIEQLENQLDRKTKSMASARIGVATSSKNGGTHGNMDHQQHQRLTTELRELAEDRGQIEQMAKESLRSMQEQVQETATKLHDAEMSLINVDEECTFLRQRCTDFETQMGRQRDEFDALLCKYNSVKELLHARIEPTTESQQQKDQETSANFVNSTTSSTNDSDTNGTVPPDHQKQQQNLVANEVQSTTVTEQMAKEQIHSMEQQVQESTLKLQDAEKRLNNAEKECASLRQRCTNFESLLVRQRADYDALAGNFNGDFVFALVVMSLYAYSSLESFFLIFAAFVLFIVWSVDRQQKLYQQNRLFDDDIAAAASSTNDVDTGNGDAEANIAAVRQSSPPAADEAEETAANMVMMVEQSVAEDGSSNSLSLMGSCGSSSSAFVVPYEGCSVLPHNDVGVTGGLQEID